MSYSQLSIAMSSDESNPSVGDGESVMNEGNDSGYDYAVSFLSTNAPYRDKPFAVPGEIAEAYHYEDDIHDIPLATIEARFKRRINVDSL